MTFYENLVTQTQMNYSRYYGVYAAGGAPYEMSKRPALPFEKQIGKLIEDIAWADCVVVGGASGLSAAGGGGFYYEDNASYRKYFGKYAEKYGFNGAFAGMMHKWKTREEYWGYLSTFLHTTLNAEVRKPYLDLDALIRDKDFFVLTTNQDTQFVKLYDESRVAEIQGGHRFFQCAKCCTDETWDAVKPVNQMYEAMGENLAIPAGMAPKCPHCGGEAFPWVRGYGNFLTGEKYEAEYQKVSDYILKNKDRKMLFIELGVGRMTPEIHRALEAALTASVDNMERIEGRTLIAVDTSGSMSSTVSARSDVRCCDIATLLGVLSSRICEDAAVCYFDSIGGSTSEGYRIAHYGKFNSILETCMKEAKAVGGTDLALPLYFALEKDPSVNIGPFDRIIYFSDNECNSSWNGLYKTVQGQANKYRRKYNPNFWVHGVDLQGYGTQQFCGERFNLIAGWSDTVLPFINMAEKGFGTLVKTIEAYEVK